MLGKKKPRMKPEATGQTELSAVLWRKGLALIVSFSLLVILIVAGTVAWYTRITNVTGITMDVAKFDFTADYVSDDFIVDVTDYMGVENGKAAPGTSGMIPILVSAEDSEVDVKYSLNIDVSKMAPDFRRRIRYFYYYIPEGSDTAQEVTIQKDSLEIGGTLAKGTCCYEYIYWEWVYTLSKDCYYNTSTDKWVKGEGGKFDDEAVNEFDAFDTKLGLGEFDVDFQDSDGIWWHETEETVEVVDGPPAENEQTEPTTVKRKIKAYQKAMETKLMISGAQAKPEKGENAGSGSGVTGLVPGMTVMKPAEAGSNGGTGGGETGN